MTDEGAHPLGVAHRDVVDLVAVAAPRHDDHGQSPGEPADLVLRHTPGQDDDPVDAPRHVDERLVGRRAASDADHEHEAGAPRLHLAAAQHLVEVQVAAARVDGAADVADDRRRSLVALLQAAAGVGVHRVEAGEEQADHARAPGGQTAGGAARHVAESIHRGEHALARRLLDGVRLPEHPRDRRDRDARVGGDVVDGRDSGHRCTLLLLGHTHDRRAPERARTVGRASARPVVRLGAGLRRRPRPTPMRAAA